MMKEFFLIEVPKHIKGLIFDCDGTLVDSMPLHMEAWENAVNKFKAPWNYDFFFSKKGMREIEIGSIYKKEFNFDLNENDLVEEKHKYFKNHLSSLKPIEPVVQVANKYQGKLPMSVASGGTRENVVGQLQSLGIINLFDHILTADDNIKPKPEPDLFLFAAKLMNVEPEYCQVFEDGEFGIQAAVKAGMIATDIRLLI